MWARFSHRSVMLPETREVNLEGGDLERQLMELGGAPRVKGTTMVTEFGARVMR